MRFYWFIFADGYRTCCAGLDRVEMQHLVNAHGKLVKKVMVSA